MMLTCGGLLFNLCASLSVLLLVTTTVMWVRSYWTEDTLIFVEDSNFTAEGLRFTSREFSSTYGCVGVFAQELEDRTYRAITDSRITERMFWLTEAAVPFPKYGGDSLLNRLGFYFGTVRQNAQVTTSVRCPHWCLAALFGLAPSIQLWRLMRKRRASARGFDIVGTQPAHDRG